MFCAAAVLAAAMPRGGHASTVADRVVDALRRPALAVQRPGQCVLLSAARVGGAVVAVGERGLIVRSEDEGKSWIQQSSPTSVTLTAIEFGDDLRGVAVGHGGVVLSTSDGGKTWQMSLDGAQIAQLMLEDARRRGSAELIAQAVGLVRDGPDKPLLALQWLGARRWVALGAYGLAIRSEDDGATWQAMANPLENPRGMHVYAIRSVADTVLLAGEQGTVFTSADGGRTFVRRIAPYRGTFFAAEIDPVGRWWLAGLRGHVFSSADSGGTWTPWMAASSANITGSLLRGSEPLFATQGGQILRPAHGGLVASLKMAIPPINSLLVLKDSALLALTIAGPVRLPAFEASTS